MGFLRRLLGGAPGEASPGGKPGSGPGEEPRAEGRSAGEDEAARDRELLRAEAERLDDELLQRQLRYADRSWIPPRQGGERRAGDADASEG